VFEAFHKIPNFGKRAGSIAKPYVFLVWLKKALQNANCSVGVTLVTDPSGKKLMRVQLGDIADGTFADWRKFAGRREFSRRSDRWSAAQERKGNARRCPAMPFMMAVGA